MTFRLGVLFVALDAVRRNVERFLHVLVLEPGHEQHRILAGPDEQEEGAFQRLEGSSGQIIDAV